MIHEHSKLADILDFAIREPESTDDLLEMLKESSVDDVKKILDLGLRLANAGVRAMNG